MSEHHSEGTSGDIAIVGMAGRFPASPSVGDLWRNLVAGVECVRFFTEDELREAGVPAELYRDPNYVPAHGYLEGIDLFDAAFFEITPREAEVTDPQIRLFLETCWEALEDAGIDPERHRGAIGVFAGASNNAYVIDNLITRPDVIHAVGFTQAALGNHTDFVATRASYKLDLKGPSVTVQTACSTGLVAVHMACQSLLSGESDAVLAGGVCVTNLKKQGYLFVEGGTNTHDGHVRAFDAAADGMLGGNGVAIVVLKRLEDALTSGDTIHAVIKGTAINNDGSDKVTFTAPSVNGQSQVILDALDVAGVDPATIGMLEAHGTGTPLGDPIEIAALTQAWRTKTDERGYCRIGSLKSNCGHLDIAAGVAGLIKAALALEHGVVPPTLHFQRPNPEIDFAASPFVVNTKASPLEARHGAPRRAAVSSFGMGGTNAHAVLEESPEPAPTTPARGPALLLLSARTQESLDEATRRLADHLEGPGAAQDLADVAFTTQVGRKGFEERRAVVAATHAEAVEALRSLDRRRTVGSTCTRKDRRVAFLFTGQGAQYPGMMAGIYASEPVFRAELDRCCALLLPHVGRDLLELIYPAPGAEAAAAAELALTQHTQPALFAVEWALAKLWASFGVEPDAMLGHSIGEYVAACLAGVFSLEDALKLVAARGRLIGALPAGGGMLAVQEAEAAVRRELPEGLSIAAVNAPGLVVVSGPDGALAAFERKLEARGVGTRRLHTSHAFHSSLMEPCLEAFRRVVRAVSLSAPKARVVSCSSGTWLTKEQATDPDYWVAHVRNTVRFADGVAALDDGSERLLLEVGPGDTLRSLAVQCTGDLQATPAVNSVRHPKEDLDDRVYLLRALGALWAHGVELDWQDGVHAGERRRRVPLPTYPFQRQSYWVEPGHELLGAAPAPRAEPDPGRKLADLADWFYVPSWRQTAPALSARAVGKRWLVFADQGGLGDALAELARSRGHDVTTVVPRAAFKRFAPRIFELAPGDPDGYRVLLDELAATGGLPTEIVHLWGADPPEALASSAELQERTFFSLLFLGAALSGRELPGPTRVGVVTTGLWDVLGARAACPDKATVLGPCKSLRGELERVACRSIDLASPAEGPAAARLFDELCSGAAEPLVALHGRGRWVLGYEPVRLEERPFEPAAARLRERGTYLITGGLGGIGLALAEELVERVQANLVLTGRAGLPPRGEWDAWLAEKPADDPTSRRIATVRGLEARGARVQVVAADVTDPAQMEAAVAAAEREFGGLHGVIHAAGLVGAGLMATKTRAEAEEVLASKVRGTQVLDRVLAGRELDFLFLCSSISTAAGVFAGVDYAAANAYMDAYANARAGERRATLAVCWDTWRDVGIAARTKPKGANEAFEEAMRLAIAPEEGRRAFARLLAAGLPQVYVSTRDLRLRDDFRREPAAAEPERAASAEPRKASGRRTHGRPALSTAYAEPANATEAAVAEMWADLLGLDRVGVDDDFFELGGNSLVMMQVNVRLRALFGLSLPVRELFKLQTAAQLAERVDVIRAVSGVGEAGDASEEVEEFIL